MAKKKNLRDKYKPAKIVDLKKKVEQEDSMIGSNFSNSSFLEITDGKTSKFRLFPSHDGSPDFYRMRKRYWITIEGDDGEPARRTVLDARVHGNFKKDIINEYVKWCKDNVSDTKAIEAMTHWKGGLQPDHHFMAYAVKVSKDETEFGILEFKKTVRDAINKATFVEEDDEPIEVDPFTDIEDGLPILIKYNSKPNKKKKEDYYDVQVGRKAIAISDEDLEKFDEAKPLIELYNGVYNLTHFELALEGLRYFDSEHEIDAFDDDQWLEIVELLKSAVEDSSEDEDEEEKPKRKKSSKRKVEEEEEEDDSDDDDDFDEDEDEDEDDSDDDEDEDDEDEDEDELEELDRSELKKYIKANELSVKVKKSMDDDDIREAIREALEDEDDDEDGELSVEEIRKKLKKGK